MAKIKVACFYLGHGVLLFTITGDGVGPQLRFRIFVLLQETWRPNLEASSSMADRAIGYFVLLVDK